MNLELYGGNYFGSDKNSLQRISIANETPYEYQEYVYEYIKN